MFAKKPARLGQWDGRRRSSRGEPPLWSSLAGGAVRLRLAVASLTVLAATLLAAFAGPSLHPGLHQGRVCRYDLRGRAPFEVVHLAQTDRLRAEAVERLPSGVRENPAARKRARESVPPVVVRYPAGCLLVRRGKPITGEEEALLHAEARAWRRTLGAAGHFLRAMSFFLVFALLAALVILYVSRFQRCLAGSSFKVLTICALAVSVLGLGLVLARAGGHVWIVPLIVAALVLTIAYNPPFALLLSLCLSLALTTAVGGNLDNLLVAMAGQATAILVLRQVHTRTRLVEVGLLAGLASGVTAVAVGLSTGQTWAGIAQAGGAAFLWGALAGFLVSGALPLIERCFGVVTDVRLLELGDGSHPLLQELVCRAPGTYTHSMTVATLAEAAAEAVGANPLLARVGSYFHDIGKMLKPQYFVENQAGENRHATLEPALSTLIIIGHVKDGMALAGEYRLPRPIVDVIEQHHGTTLVEYFYREALRLQQEAGGASGGGPDALEPNFRYPGPKPRSREAGIVMLADATESASRALSAPTPGSLRKLIHDILMKRLLDGQFEESGLTLTELRLIEESLYKGLTALYHSRIQYPEPEERRVA
jgi:putative nucleotidyltransferase with HDIG domain